ncbi:MAG TPA: nitrilase-related carbon-nitrogen hydrolase, partial [Planctomycetota bacterium]|nr:nitrilase-related carbon-nitrogen hydrolase [Planctomycetota bacterium]
MKVALAQINPTVGDFTGNRRLIERAAIAAAAAGARLVVFPEQALCGYPAEDLLLRETFLQAHDRALEALAGTLPPNLCVLVGCLARNERRHEGGRPLFNAVAAIEDGLVRIVARKSLLPTYDVFDEARYF